MILPAYAEPLSDKTGLKTVFDVEVAGKAHTVEVVANFNVKQVAVQQGDLVLEVDSSLQNNFGELQIPHNVTSGEQKYYLDGAEFFPKVLRNEKISFVTLEFEGNGSHTIRISGQPAPDVAAPSDSESDSNEQSSLYTMALMLAAIAAIVTLMYNKRRSRISGEPQKS